VDERELGVARRYVIIGGTMIEVSPELLEQLGLPAAAARERYFPDTALTTFDPLSDPLNDPFPEEMR
jgi:hypothetical protein